ncbi:MAG: FAD-dependent oxidoreductase [Emcibacter sp.]|nr:FAD-dependent oxidoreductase [Emcibacter sp.]
MSDVIHTKTVRRTDVQAIEDIEADICILGAGISGLTAALEAAKLGRTVVLVDGAPAIGGQAIGSQVGTLIGLYTHGPDAYQITYGIAEDLVNELKEEGSFLTRNSARTGTITFQYDEIRMGRWFEQKLEDAGVKILLGATLSHVEFKDKRVQHIDLITRYGAVKVKANGYVDASGDASLCWEAGLDLREPTAPIYGTMNFLIEGYDTDVVDQLDINEVHARLVTAGHKYGVRRHDGFLMHFSGKGFMLANIGHFETPMDPMAAADMVLEGRRQADKVLRFLQGEFSNIFKGSQIRAYGNPGLRQTRWIVGEHQLTLDEIKEGARPEDAVARCAWWVELHDTEELVHWEEFPYGHVYYIPLSCMLPKGVDNIVAAGRCVDGDSHALSAIRVMGPCMSMGMAAAHALDMAGSGKVSDINIKELQERLCDNLDRKE